MTRISLISLWARKRRMASIALAVVLGVAFLTGTLVLGDTLSTNFDRLFSEVSAGTDVVVRNATEVETDRGADDTRGPIDQSLLDVVRNVDGVADAEGEVVGYGALLGRDGDPVGGNGPPRMAGTWITNTDLNPYKLVEGRAPEAPDEVVVNQGAADDGKLAVGDTTVVQTPAPVDVTVVGIATFGDEPGLGGTTFTGFTLEGAQANVIGQDGVVSSIVVEGDGDVSSDELRDRVTAALPDGVEAITGDQLATERADEIGATFLDMLRTLLVVFAGIAVVVATLSITNTFSITVAQRTRELALLRAVGASRRQVRRSVTVEALGVGVVAAAVGVVAGLGVAGLLKGMFDSFGFALPAGGMEIRPLSVLAGFGVGVVATVIASQSAARRASRLAPIEAMRETSAEMAPLSRRRMITGIALVVLGVERTIAAALSGSFLFAGLAALSLVVGMLLLAPVALSPAARLLGGLLRRVRGVNGMLAEQNARRNPRRSAATATALVVGVAVVSLFTVFAASTKATLDDQISSDFGADLAIGSAGFGEEPLSSDMVDEVAQLPEVDQAVAVGGGALLLDGESANVTATDPARLADVAGIRAVDGDLGSVGADGIAVDESRAEDEGWHVGSTVELTYTDGATETATVEAIYEDNALLGSLVLPRETWMAHTTQATDRIVMVTVADGTGVDEARRAIQPLADRQGTDVQDRDDYATAATQGLDMMLAMVYVLLALAVIIALLGISNTLSLAVHERRRELGLLRAVGQTRRQVRSVLRLESVIVSAFGTVVGLVLGGFLGWGLLATVWSDDGGTFSLPIIQLAVIGVLGAVAGVLAARRPAKRAARLPILDAIATQ
jgi:putative ABC transport system permease protein